MKKVLEYMMFGFAYIMVATNFMAITLQLWVDSDNPNTVAYSVAISVAVLLAGFMFVWPILLGFGKSFFSGSWAKAGHQAMWSTHSIGYIYVKRYWWKFLLHAVLAGVAVFILHMLADIIVFSSFSHVVERLILSAKYMVFFLLGIVVATGVRYLLYLKHTHGISLTKY